MTSEMMDKQTEGPNHQTNMATNRVRCMCARGDVRIHAHSLFSFCKDARMAALTCVEKANLYQTQ